MTKGRVGPVDCTQPEGIGGATLKILYHRPV
jgi:hypothetical protein